MISRPINSTIKKQVQTIWKSATKKAERDFSENIESKIVTFDLFNQLVVLNDEIARIKIIRKNHQYPFYLDNYSSDEWLETQFASRTYLLCVDESEQMFDAIWVGKYDYLLRNRFADLADQVPKYTYKEFLSGIVCPYFENFKKIFNVEEQNFYKIRDWQAANLLKVVTYEYLRLIEIIQAHCKLIDDPLEFIVSQKELIETKLNSANENATELKKVFSQLFIFNNVDVKRYDDELLVNNFKIYNSKKLNWKQINPLYFKSILKQVDSNKHIVLSSELTLFYTLNKISDWFESVIAGKPIQERVKETDWDELLNQLNKDVEDTIEPLIEEIEYFIQNKENSKENVRTFLIDKMEEYRHKFNNFEEKRIISVLSEDKADILKRGFITNSFFGNAIESQIKDFKEAMIIYKMSWEVVNFFTEYFNTRRVIYPKENDSQFQVMSLMNRMVFDRELYLELTEATNEFMEHFHSYRLPFEFFSQNQSDYAATLFHKSLERLQTVLDDADPSNKILFLQTRLKELRYWDILSKQYDEDKKERKRSHKYSKLFEEFLLIETEFIKQVREVIPILPFVQHKPLSISHSTQNFDSLIPNEKQIFILNLLEDLSITVNGKSVLSERKKGAVRGVVDALLENNLVPQISIETLCNIVAEKIGLELKSKLDFTQISKSFKSRATQYIKSNYKNL